MRKLMESRKGMLFGALFFTGVCLLYGIAIFQMGLFAALRNPSPMANFILLVASGTLAVICWYRFLRWKPNREEFRNRKNPALWAGMTVLCLLLAGLWLFLYLRLGRSAAALAVSVWMLACAAVSAVRAVKSGRKGP